MSEHSIYSRSCWVPASLWPPASRIFRTCRTEAHRIPTEVLEHSKSQVRRTHGSCFILSAFVMQYFCYKWRNLSHGSLTNWLTWISYHIFYLHFRYFVPSQAMAIGLNTLVVGFLNCSSASWAVTTVAVIDHMFALVFVFGVVVRAFSSNLRSHLRSVSNR